MGVLGHGLGRSFAIPSIIRLQSNADADSWLLVGRGQEGQGTCPKNVEWQVSGCEKAGLMDGDGDGDGLGYAQTQVTDRGEGGRAHTGDGAHFPFAAGLPYYGVPLTASSSQADLTTITATLPCAPAAGLNFQLTVKKQRRLPENSFLCISLDLVASSGVSGFVLY